MTTSAKNEITAQIEALEIQFKAIPCDNNGNPVCWVTYHRLLGKIEALESILFGNGTPNTGITVDRSYSA